MVHEFLSAIGIARTAPRENIRKLLTDVQWKFTNYSRISLDDELDFYEFRKECAKSLGISIYGEIDKTKNGEVFEKEYYLPYFKGQGITSHADILIERRPDKNAYVGICDDVRVEVSLVFHLLNIIDLLEEQKKNSIPKLNTSVTLSGLANSGTILLPVKKNAEQERTKKEESRNRMMLLSAAREGDSAAIESLTLEDIDTYTKVSRRLVTEDVFSIVESYFMPYGVECDQYSIMGEIMAVGIKTNKITKTKIYTLTLDVNELQFDVCVPVDELIGMPAVGRRFKGNIWLQGYINFE